MPAPTPIDSGIIYDLPALSSPAIHPSGDSVAYVQTTVDRESYERISRIRLVDGDGRNDRDLTAGPSDSAPAWSPDGATLAFLRRGDDEHAQIWLLPAGGGEARRLTALPLGARAFVWAPDGASLCAVADVDPDRPTNAGNSDGTNSADAATPPRVREVHGVYYRGDTLGWRGDARWHLFHIDAASGEATALTRGDYNHASPVYSPDGSLLAFTSTRSRNRQRRWPYGYEVCLMPAGGGRVRRLTPDVWNAGPLTWSPDGKRLAAILAEQDQPSQPYLYAIDVRSGERTRLTGDGVAPQTGFFPIVAAPPLTWTNRGILCVADARASSGLYLVSERGRLTPVRDKREIIAGHSVSADGRRVALVATTPRRPGEVMLQERPSNRTRQLTHATDAYLAAHPPGDVERFTVRRGGKTIDCWLMFPPGFNRGRRYPLVLEIHGGPNSFFGAGFNTLHQIIAGAGNIVLFVNPRGSTTYGADFTDAVTADWGGEDYADLQAAVDAACERPYVDDRRLGIHGYSYGGYMTSWTVGHTHRFKAAVVGAPVVNLLSMYGTSDISVPWGSYQWGGRPVDNFEQYVQRSPLTHAHRIQTPVLLLHGEADVRCPISQSEELYVALKERRKTVEFVRFPDCSHLFLRTGHPELQREYYDRVVDWYRRWL